MKKGLLIICIILMLTGCGAENSPYKVIDYTFGKPRIQKILPAHVFEEVPDDDSWKYDVAERLYNEFCHFYANIGDRMENDTYYREYEIDWNYRGTGIPVFYTGYNRLMAADRAKGETKLKNKSWNLYTVSEICDELMIETDGVIIELFNDIP